MGKFIVSRTAAGDRFVLETDLGYTLATSRVYATLDACKKGIASLVANAPTVPVRDLTAGERGPNPKIEITGAEGAYRFVLKSANGRSVIESGSFATKKACLRAISMLRTGVTSVEVLFEQKGGLIPLQIKALRGGAETAERESTAVLPADTQETVQVLDEPIADEVIAEDTDVAEEPVAEPPVPPPAPVPPAAPRLVRPKPAPAPAPPKAKTASTSARKPIPVKPMAIFAPARKPSPTKANAALSSTRKVAPANSKEANAPARKSAPAKPMGIFAPVRKPTPPKPPKKRSLLDILLKK